MGLLETLERDKVRVVSGDEALKIADALNATTLRMLQILWSEYLIHLDFGSKSL